MKNSSNDDKMYTITSKPTNFDLKLDKQVNLCIAIPTMGSIETQLVTTLLRYQSDAKKIKNLNLAFYFTYMASPVSRARNDIAKHFLAKKDGVADYTHLLFIDSDTIPPVDGLFKLLQHDKDIISGMTPILHYDRELGGRFQTMDNCFTKVDIDEETGK